MVYGPLQMGGPEIKRDNRRKMKKWVDLLENGTSL